MGGLTRSRKPVATDRICTPAKSGGTDAAPNLANFVSAAGKACHPIRCKLVNVQQHPLVIGPYGEHVIRASELPARLRRGVK